MGDRRRNDPLLERERQTEAITKALTEAAIGRGSLCLIEGPAGIGKTRLLDLAAERGASGGAEVLRARGAELEHEYAWGVVRQLFERWLLEQERSVRKLLLAGAAEGATGALGFSTCAEQEAFAAIHGLYWLVVNMADRQPLVLIIDDLQWIDEASLRWLGYLSARVERLPVVLVMAVRRPDPAAGRELLRRLTAEPLARVVGLAPLSLAATCELLQAHAELPYEGALASACHVASGGNPFLLRALFDDLANSPEHAPPDAESVRFLRPEAIIRSFLLRFDRMPEETKALGRAIAVLGGAATITRAGRLANVDDADAVTAAAALAAAGILTDASPPAFVHPVVHGIVLEDMPAALRARWHASAAVILRQSGGTLHEISAQLVQSEPTANPDVSATLCEAARVALMAGAPQEAIALLERAEREPPPDSARSRVMRLLGRAMIQTRGAAGIGGLTAAVELAHDPLERLNASLELAQALEGMSHNVEATAVYEKALNEFSLPDEALRAKLKAGLATAAAQQLSTLPRALELVSAAFSDGSGAPAKNPVMRAVMALAVTVTGVPDGAEMAVAALEGTTLFEADTSIAVGLAIAPLVWSDRLDAALSAWDEVLERARTRGAPLRYAFAMTFRADVHLRAGRLADAVADARAALEVPQRMWLSSLPVDTPAVLAEALIQCGALEEAERLLAPETPAMEFSDYQGNNLLLMARGRLRLAQGRMAQAIEDLLELGRRCDAFGLRNPAAIRGVLTRRWLCITRTHAVLLHWPTRKLSSLARSERLARSGSVSAQAGLYAAEAKESVACSKRSRCCAARPLPSSSPGPRSISGLLSGARASGSKRARPSLMALTQPQHAARGRSWIVPGRS